MGEIKSTHLATTRRRGFKIFHAVVGDAQRRHPLLVDEPGLPGRCARRRGPTVVIFGDVKLDSSGLHFLNPEFEIVERRPGGAERRPDRAVLRAHRHGDAEHAAQAGAPRARRRCRRSCRISCPPTCARASGWWTAGRRSKARTFPAGERTRSRTLNAFRVAGAAAADLRGVLPLPARPRLASPRGRRRSQAAPHHGGRSHPQVGGRACCRSR